MYSLTDMEIDDKSSNALMNFGPGYQQQLAMNPQQSAIDRNIQVEMPQLPQAQYYPTKVAKRSLDYSSQQSAEQPYFKKPRQATSQQEKQIQPQELYHSFKPYFHNPCRIFPQFQSQPFRAFSQHEPSIVPGTLPASTDQLVRAQPLPDQLQRVQHLQNQLRQHQNHPPQNLASPTFPPRTPPWLQHQTLKRKPNLHVFTSLDPNRKKLKSQHTPHTCSQSPATSTPSSVTSPASPGTPCSTPHTENVPDTPYQSLYNSGRVGECSGARPGPLEDYLSSMFQLFLNGDNKGKGVYGWRA